MNMILPYCRFVLPALLVAFACQLSHADETKIAVRGLDVETAQKKVVRYSMMGPRDTIVFYTFDDQKAVLLLRVGNKSVDFPISGTLHLFAAEVSPKHIAKWVNNQHSDALFMGVPKPISSVKLAQDLFKVTARNKAEGQTKHQTKLFDDYTVDFEVRAVEQQDAFSLKAFKDKVGVFVQVEDEPAAKRLPVVPQLVGPGGIGLQPEVTICRMAPPTLKQRLQAAKMAFIGQMVKREESGDWIQAELQVLEPIFGVEKGQRIGVTWPKKISDRFIIQGQQPKGIAILNNQYKDRYFLDEEKFESLEKLDAVREILREGLDPESE